MIDSMTMSSIERDDKWAFKIQYLSSDIAWLTLLNTCVEHDALNCLAFLIEDDDFSSESDFKNMVDKAVNKNSPALAYSIVTNSNDFTLKDYLSDNSLKNKSELLRLISAEYVIDWEELLESDLVNQEVFLSILDQKLTTSTLLSQIIYYLDIGSNEIEKALQLAIERADSLNEDTASYIFHYYEKNYTFTKETCNSFMSKCPPKVIDNILIDRDMSQETRKFILLANCSKLSGRALMQDIKLIEKVIIDNDCFARQIIDHSDFESESYDSDEGYSWRCSIARTLFTAHCFKTINLLIGKGASVSCFAKITIKEEEEIIVRGIYEEGCTTDHHEFFFNDIQQLLDNGVVYLKSTLISVGGNIVNFNFNRLFELLNRYSNLDREKASDIIEEYYGSMLTSYEGIPYETAQKNHFRNDDFLDPYYYYQWNYEALAYSPHESLLL